MRVKVLYFSIIRTHAGRDGEDVDVPEGTSTGSLLAQTLGRFPALADARKSILLAVNREWTDDSRLLKDGDEVAIMPPVSGG